VRGVNRAVGMHVNAGRSSGGGLRFHDAVERRRAILGDVESGPRARVGRDDRVQTILVEKLDRAAAIAKKAYAEGRPVREVAAEMTDLGQDRLAKLLDPATLTRGGVRNGGSEG